jgi:predicted transcriptional regulator
VSWYNDNHLVPGISRRGNCWDKAVAESFFSSLKKEQIKRRIYASLKEAKSDVFDYIEGFYNQVRRHSYLDPMARLRSSNFKQEVDLCLLKRVMSNFGMMPVAEDDRMIGTISDRDIAIRGIGEGLGAEAKVRQVMSEGVAWAYEDDSVEKAAGIMSDYQVRRLPVVNSEKRLVGIVALGDFAVDSSEMRPTAKALTEISKPS